jgi:hypothetical protein
VRYLEHAVLATMWRRALHKSSQWASTTTENSGETRSPGTAGESLDTIQAFDEREEPVFGPTVPSNSHSRILGYQVCDERSSCEACGNVITLACENLKTRTYQVPQMHSCGLSEVESKATQGCPDCVVIFNVAKAYKFDANFHLNVDGELDYYNNIPRSLYLWDTPVGHIYLYRADGEFSFYMVHVYFW